VTLNLIGAHMMIITMRKYLKMFKDYYLSKTFENFNVTPANSAAFEISRLVAEHTVSGGTSCFGIVGTSSVGKTHLLCAMHREIELNAPDLRILHISTEEFVESLCSAIINKCALEFRDRVLSNNVIILDNIEYTRGKEATQHEVFDIVKQLLLSKKTVIGDFCFRNNEKYNNADVHHLYRKFTDDLTDAEKAIFDNSIIMNIQPH
jgi:chromosomal replication initiation ATPase DnaA